MPKRAVYGAGPDVISVHQIAIQAIIGTNLWGQEASQQAYVSISVPVNGLEAICESDDIKDSTLDYRNIYDAVMACSGKPYFHAWCLSERIAKRIASCVSYATWDGAESAILVELTKGTDEGTVEFSSIIQTFNSKPHIWRANWVKFKAHTNCILGILPQERERKQNIVLEVKILGQAPFKKETEIQNAGKFWLDGRVFNQIILATEETKFLTVEKLVHELAQSILYKYGIAMVEIEAFKPAAFPLSIKGPSVRVRRIRTDFPGLGRLDYQPQWIIPRPIDFPDSQLALQDVQHYQQEEIDGAFQTAI